MISTRTGYLSMIMIACVILVLPTIVNETYATYGNSVNQVQTITVGSTASTSFSQGQQIINRAFKVLSITGTTLPCQVYNFTFPANEGQYVSGNFTSVVPLDVYIVTNQTFQNWQRSGSCGNPADALASQMNTMAYNFNGIITSSGTWDIVLVNTSNRDADGFMVAYLSASSTTIIQPLLSTITGATSASIPPSIPGFPIESIAIGALIGVALIVLLRRRRRVR